MSAEQNKALMRRFTEFTVQPDPSPVKSLLAPYFIANGNEDREAFVLHLNYFLTAFSDTYYTVEEQIAEGELVVTTGIWGGTHSGDFQGLPPSGKSVAINAILIDRIQDGKIVEHRGLFDNLGILQQLGMVPAA
jgi:predicted ester cyclase